MGKVLSTIYRPVRDFNLESRAHKIISKDKPMVAPKHKSDEKQYIRLIKELPKIEETVKKNENLDKYLKNVYVTSHDETPKPVHDPLKPLPLDRHTVEESVFGYHEPKHVPYGRVTLKSALKFISEHQTNSGENTVIKIAENYKLSEETIKNIVNYFRVYEVYVPDRKTKTQFLGPLVSRKQIVSIGPKNVATNDSNTTSQS